MTRLLPIVLALAAGVSAAAPRTYDNPVIGGFHPDPSICRVGGDYYLANSSFEYFPGVPIFHSRDLVHWRQIGHALTRSSQLPLAGQRSSRGIYAPTLRCHGGKFTMISTNTGSGGNFYVQASDPAGPWSEPIWIEEDDSGIDPSLLFDDDGKVYYTRHGGGERGGIVQSEIDLATGKLLGTPRMIWKGTGGIWPEGPHLYKIKGMYYLMIAEGGTSYGHAVTVARSASPWGPFEPAPNNPVLTHRDRPELPLQATGHGDLVQAEDGRWWMVLLGIRPNGRKHHIGRETLLAPVRWNAQGWPTVNDGLPLAEQMNGDGLPPADPWPAVPVRTNFDQLSLGLEWNTVRGPGTGLYSLSDKPGTLRLKGSDDTLADIATPAFVGRRQEHLHMRAATEIVFDPSDAGQEAGLALRMNEANHYLLRVSGSPKRQVELVTRVQGESRVAATLPVEPGPLTLEVRAWPDRYEFSVRSGKGPARRVGSAATADLSSEQAGGFTGVYIGMYAVGANADFNWFDYQPLD